MSDCQTDWMDTWREPTDLTTALDALAATARRLSVAERDPGASAVRRAMAWSAFLVAQASALRIEVDPGPLTLGQECGWREDEEA